MTDQLRRIAVVGLGRLGTCLARALHVREDVQLVLASTRFEVTDALVAELGPRAQAAPPASVCDRAQLIFLTVPDAAIAGLCAQLACDASHAIVHTSGAIDRCALDAARARGAATGVFHPLQAFTASAPVARFAGIQIGVEADAALERELEQLASGLGAGVFSLHGVDRARYHAAAVFASNYLVALHSAAARVWQQAGLPIAAARGALTPLTHGALEAIAQHELADALTGPLARGDEATLHSHLQALSGDPAAEVLYRALAAELLRLPLPLEPELRARLLRLIGRAP